MTPREALQPPHPQQPQQRASLNSNYDLSAELVQVLVNQQHNSENQNQPRSNSENQNNQLRSNSENQNQLRSTQQQPQEQEEENEDSWINAYRRHRQ